MNEVTCLEFNALPSMAVLYVKALFSSKKSLDPETALEKVVKKITGITINPKKINEFKKVCGFSGVGDIPLTYYYSLGQRAQLILLTDSAFPLPVAGLIHLENIFTQYRAAAIDDTFDVECRIGQDHITPTGREFEIITDFTADNIPVVECRSRFLSRSANGHPTSRPKKMQASTLAGEAIRWQLPAGAGRTYAKVSGDYNPIHLYSWSAKLFGFNRQIAQGMFLLSKVAAAFEECCRWEQKIISVMFKSPVFLPSTVDLIVLKEENAYAFEIRSASGEKLHLTGSYIQPERLR